MAVIFDTDTTYEKVPDTEVSMTINQNSRILAIFSGNFRLAVDGDFDGATNFLVVLSIEGIGNQTTKIQFYDSSGPYPGTSRVISHVFNLVYQSGSLSAGTYTISVYWKSELDSAGSTQINLSIPISNRTRSLLVQEIL